MGATTGARTPIHHHGASMIVLGVWLDRDAWWAVCSSSGQIVVPVGRGRYPVGGIIPLHELLDRLPELLRLVDLVAYGSQTTPHTHFGDVVSAAFSAHSRYLYAREECGRHETPSVATAAVIGTRAAHGRYR